MNIPYKVLKRKAIILRRKGFSYNEISKKIGTPKSTLSYWLKNIYLEPKYKQRLYTKQIQILSLGAPSQRERRKKEVEIIIKQAMKEIELPISLEAYRFIGASLYWAEGAKGGCFAITNSDPHLILFIVKWINKILNIQPNQLKAWLNIYPQQNDSEIKGFWSQLTGIPIKNFGKSHVKAFSSGYKKNNLYYGTIKVTIPRSTNIKHQIFGWIRAVLEETELETMRVKQRWEKITRILRPVNL